MRDPVAPAPSEFKILRIAVSTHCVSFCCCCYPGPVQATVWMLSDGTTGSSPNAAVDANVNNVLADVNTVAYDDDYVFIRTSGVPSHSIGPFGPNPSLPGDLDATYRVSLNPTEAVIHEITRLGSIGVAVNGAVVSNWSDATWAYFTTYDVNGSGTDLDGDLAFPFTVGPTYFGVVDQEITMRNAVITVPDDVTYLYDYHAPDDADFDWDGDVDGADFLLWQRNYHTPVAGVPGDVGDATKDGFVDSADLGVWETQFGSGTIASVAVTTVPESNSAALIIVSLGTLLLFSPRYRLRLVVSLPSRLPQPSHHRAT